MKTKTKPSRWRLTLAAIAADFQAPTRAQAALGAICLLVAAAIVLAVAALPGGSP